MTDLFSHIENNVASQQHFEENKVHFSKQCEYLYNLLMRGESITVHSGVLDHGINSVPRRILDLRNAGIKISDTFLSNEDRPKFKSWFMSQEDKAHNEKIRG